jgi:hypothetical protein
MKQNVSQFVLFRIVVKRRNLKRNENAMMRKQNNKEAKTAKQKRMIK